MFAPENSQTGDFGFTLSFWAGLGVGFLLGILATYIGNWLWEKHKKKKRGTKPYFNLHSQDGQIQFEGQVSVSTTGQNAVINTIIRATIPSQQDEQLPLAEPGRATGDEPQEPSTGTNSPD